MAVLFCSFIKKAIMHFLSTGIVGFIDTEKLEEEKEEAVKEAEVVKKEEVKAEDEETLKPVTEG